MANRRPAHAVCAAILTTLLISPAQALSSRLTTLYTFNGAPDGGVPSGVVIGSRGVLYGTTYLGGTSNTGTVFSLTPPASPGGVWTEKILHEFSGSEGIEPVAGLAIGKKGILYGTTVLGGTSNDGTVFSLTPPASLGGDWTETVLHSFTFADGFEPWDSVAIGPDGTIYGTTQGGGSSRAYGTIFALTPPASSRGAWTPTVLLNFTSDGSPYSGVTIGKDGVLYGTTPIGGKEDYGAVYSLKPPESPGDAWTETIIHHFTSHDGLSPYAGVVIGPGGVLYGATKGGGLSHLGTVFSLTPPASPGAPWTETVLFSFGGDGRYPTSGVIIGKGGVLYGTTSSGGKSGAGTVFALRPPASPGGAWTERVLHDFTGGSDGGVPSSNLVIGPDGLLYGSTTSGGTGVCLANPKGCGTVYSLKP